METTYGWLLLPFSRTDPLLLRYANAFLEHYAGIPAEKRLAVYLCGTLPVLLARGEHPFQITEDAYDSVCAEYLSSGDTREQAREHLKRSLAEWHIPYRLERIYLLQFLDELLGPGHASDALRRISELLMLSLLEITARSSLSEEFTRSKT